MKQELEHAVNQTEKALLDYCKLRQRPDGLLPDEHKTDEYWKLKANFRYAFNQLRKFNASQRSERRDDQGVKNENGA